MNNRNQKNATLRHLTCWVLGAGLLCLFGGSPAQAASSDAGQGWYAPSAADFQQEYQRDTANQREQSWDAYWGTVRKFYSGGRFLMVRKKGWTAECEGFLRSLNSPQVKAELQQMLNEAGRLIGSEWAKDKDVRRIADDDLKKWADRMKQAKAADDGSGQVVRKTAVAVRAEIGSLLAQSRSNGKQTASAKSK